jgi:signal transduction histidine kinase
MSASAYSVKQPASPQLFQPSAFDLSAPADAGRGLASVLSIARLVSGAARVEWWEGDRFVAANGFGDGPRCDLELGTFGAFVFYGGHLASRVASALEELLPLFQGLRGAELLAMRVGELVRRNQALEEFAELVAHELKTPLHEALIVADGSKRVQEALELIDALLMTARDGRPVNSVADVIHCLESVVRGIGVRAQSKEITFDVSMSLPITLGALRVIVRNLLTNALAAGATHVHVSCLDETTLVVDDDGVGLGGTGYASGSGLGLGLCRRIASAFGGRVELAQGPHGGTRATLEFGATS